MYRAAELNQTQSGEGVMAHGNDAHLAFAGQVHNLGSNRLITGDDQPTDPEFNSGPLRIGAIADDQQHARLQAPHH